MFKKKQNQLIEAPKTTSSASTSVSSNPFIQSGLKKNVQTLSGNGAVKYSSSGNLFVDQFTNVSRYRTPRSFDDVSTDMITLWGLNPLLTLMFTFYLRLITRVTSLFSGIKTGTTQRGQGMKHESIFRMMWIAVNHPNTFWKNIPYFISVGSWKDIITMLSYDLQYNGWKDRKLDWNKMGQLILAGLENPNQSNLLKKYLPQIKSNSVCKTLESQADNIIAKWICSLLFGGKTQSDNYKNYRAYRKLKSSGTAHQWQQLISQHKMFSINFDTIHGRALSQLVSSKFLKNQGLESKYESWISSKPMAKFTGYVYELAEKITSNMLKYQKDTINAQFNQLVEVAKKGLDQRGLRPISVLDCSGSMSSPMYLGGGKTGKLNSITVAMASAIFFDEMIQSKSPFKNVYLHFSGKTEMSTFKGNNFVDRFLTSPRVGYGGTNFESVFTFFAEFKRNHPDVNENLIPNFIVCFSDGEFNSVSTYKDRIITNVEKGKQILTNAGFSKDYVNNFGICFVDLPNTFYGRPRGAKFETFGNNSNVFYFSGYDLSPLAFLFGVEGQTSLPKSADEMFDAAMNQEVLKLLEL